MTWILLASLGHLSNAIAFILDKTLLVSAFKRSATYAALIGMLSAVVIPAAPWVRAWPDIGSLPFVIGFGMMFVFALWLFFEALRLAEASRIVPIVGSLVPLFTLAGTAVFLGERLNFKQGIGFVLLLFATAILAGGRKERGPKRKAVGIAVASAGLFAVASVSGKIAFSQGDFLGVFILSRVSAVVAGFVVMLSDPAAKTELLSVLGSRRPADAGARGSLATAIAAQIFGSAGFFMVNAALALGSAAIVNALQAVQYAAIVIVAWFGGAKLRARLREERTPRIMLAKTFAIICVAFGLFLLVPNV